MGQASLETVHTSTPTTPKDVLVTGLLAMRTPKRPNLEAELKAFYELSQLMLEEPERAVQRFVELALELCGAGTAGLSICAKDEQGADIFRWDNLAGRLAGYVGGTTPRHFSPCGLCLDEGGPVLVARPDRVFTYFQKVSDPIIEGLVLPLYDAGQVPLATIWIVSHDEDHGFDAEDVRVMTQLAVQLALALKVCNERRHAAESGDIKAERDEAKRLAQAKMRLLATVGHDLRQPLTVVMGMVDLVAQRVGEPEKILLSKATTAVERLQRGLEMMTEAARLEIGHVLPRVRPFPLRALLGELRDQHEAAAQRKGLALRVVPCGRVVVSDPELLGSILHNLVGNAIKYTQQGRIVIGCRRLGQTVLIQVCDTGIGIAPDQADSIFEEFRQLHPADSLGMGLGLAIAKRTADLLGHSLTVKSKLGRGSCFAVQIPLALDG
jgi:signal transduction histidine kinase